MAELHIIGQLVGGYGFPSANLFCKWGTAFGTAWKVLEGKQDGQTQVDHPKVRDFFVTDNGLILPYRMEVLQNGLIQ